MLHIKDPFLISLRLLNRHYFYDKRTCIGFFKSSESARLYLEVLAWLKLKAVCIDSLLCYISFCFLFSSLCSVFYWKKWVGYLSHVISPYLHGKLINSLSAFYLSFCCTVLSRILNILIFMNKVISIICICQLCFKLFLM